ncbi:hypothetical protein [Candidatus Lariskella endosymbiont of Epinotia ramella]|uniref:hypothetical protein n=1 Tax=Candidatus Lariskella endosymbiont of Epinotia ramella TaxID=3066224 RepID=UPI0030D03712
MPIKEKNDNSLDGTNKVTTFSSLSKNLKATVLSFYEDFSTKKPESISAILTVLRQPLHKALEEQEIKAGTYNKPLALLRKEVIITNTSNNLASEEVTMLKMHEEQSEIYNEPLALLRKQFYEKAATKQDKEPPAAPPAPELNKYLLNKELSVMEVSNGLKPKIVALSDAHQEQNISAINSEAEFAEQNTAYVPSSIQKALYNASIGFKMLDSAVDSARFIHEPTANNATKVIVDSAHIYSMLAGFNLYSAVISAAEIIYLGSIGEYGKVLQNAVITTAYMALPYAVAVWSAATSSWV